MKDEVLCRERYRSDFPTDFPTEDRLKIPTIREQLKWRTSSFPGALPCHLDQYLHRQITRFMVYQQKVGSDLHCSQLVSTAVKESFKEKPPVCSIELSQYPSDFLLILRLVPNSFNFSSTSDHSEQIDCLPVREREQEMFPSLVPAALQWQSAPAQS